MKKSLNLSIPSTCSEKWENFTQTSTGGFCDVCQKNVMDFTKMTDEEIISYFQNATGETCGRFTSHQLREYRIPEVTKSKSYLKWLPASLLTGLILAIQPSEAKSTHQNVVIQSDSDVGDISGDSTVENDRIVISGVVKDEYGETIPGANILIKGTSKGTVADIDGRFKIEIDYPENKVLVVSFIGYQTFEYKIPKDIDGNIEVNLVFEQIEFLGEVVVESAYVSKPGLIQRIASGIKRVF